MLILVCNYVASYVAILGKTECSGSQLLPNSILHTYIVLSGIKLVGYRFPSSSLTATAYKENKTRYD